ncbi:hypothetical protein ACFSQJ_06910 [Croceitalea marina]|uniref:Uncharacterized protein n=1 Tax=Croceitalea marina TaxID=1775166 RepID=A0ABW5MVZ6_9FLAO
MLKSFTFSLLSIMLVISILAPSIEVLCKSSYDNILVMDLNEEENNKQETEQKFDQKELFFTDSIESRSINFSQEIAIIQTTLVSYSDFSVEIVLPPPQDLI